MLYGGFIYNNTCNLCLSNVYVPKSSFLFFFFFIIIPKEEEGENPWE